MKYLFTLCVAMICSLNSYAQYYDVNEDGRVSIEDLPVLIDGLLNGKTGTDSIGAPIIEVYKNGKIVESYKSTATENYKVVLRSHDYVDLGLPSGTLWATCNIGAKNETAYGLYFAWGETNGYGSDISDGRNFDWAHYRWMTEGKASSDYCTKYTFADGQTTACWYSNGTYVGSTVDGTTYKDLKTLLSTDDAATIYWGGAWRMPTHEEILELVNNTDNSWTTINGVPGYKFTNKTDESKYIFLPAAGWRSDTDISDAGSYGYYLSSDLYSENAYRVWRLGFRTDYIKADAYSNRYYGQSIRPVYDAKIEKTKVSSITLSSTSLSLEKGGTSTLTASVAPDDAFLKTCTWSSSNTSVATVDADGKVTAVDNGTATITCTANDGSRVSATCSVTVGDLPVYWFASNTMEYEGDIPQIFEDAINTSKYPLSSPVEGFNPPKTTAYNNGYTLTAEWTSNVGWFIVPTNKVSMFKIYSEGAEENIEDIFTTKELNSSYTLMYSTGIRFVTEGGTLKVYYNN